MLSTPCRAVKRCPGFLQYETAEPTKRSYFLDFMQGRFKIMVTFCAVPTTALLNRPQNPPGLTQGG
jgi:hypothetical protein